MLVIPAQAGIHTFACWQQKAMNILVYGFPPARE
jgi:hypothetical protein